MPKPPDPYVQASLKGGPHDGEIVTMPWARSTIIMGRWRDQEWVESSYELRGPWRGQADARYEFVGPEELAA
jgi:hypothetical protein